MKKIVTNTSHGFRLTCFKISAVAGFMDPQKEILNGVIITAAAVDTAVMLMDKAQLPLERYVMILEKFPPGQAATSIMPRAMEG